MTMFFDPFQELDRLTGSLLRRSAGVMPVDLYREGDHFVLNADLPGVDPGSVDLSVDGQTLTVRADRRIGVPEGAQWLTRERPEAAFVRQFTLGDGIDTENIHANYSNGVLSLVIPMAEKVKPRKIRIGGASQQRSVGAGSSGGEEPAQAQPVEQTRKAQG